MILKITFLLAIALNCYFASTFSASAEVNQNFTDMKTVTDNINKSLAKLTGGNSSGLLKSTMDSINNTAHQIAKESKGIVNEGSLSTAEAIAKKIGIGIADVLSNISGEIKQGIVSK